MARVSLNGRDLKVARKAIPPAREAVLILGAYFVYMLTRKLIVSDPSTAFDNADRVVDLEQSLGVHWEPAWQEWALNGNPDLILFFNWLYIFTFMPILISTAIVTYVLDQRMYLHYRNVFFVSFAVALAMFALFPLAPPRMLPGIEDTIDTFGPAFYASRELAFYYNAFAAMPSLHFAWSLIFGYMFFRCPWLFMKFVGVLYPVMTLLAITITGNHYLLDAVGGGVVMVASLSVVAYFRARRNRHSADEAGSMPA